MPHIHIGLNETHASKMMRTFVYEFTTTGNPVFAWHAYALARETATPIPECVSKYLDESAKHILAMTDPKTELAAAMGFANRGKGPGGRSKIQQALKTHRDTILTEMVFREIEQVRRHRIASHESTRGIVDQAAANVCKAHNRSVAADQRLTLTSVKTIYSKNKPRRRKAGVKAVKNSQ